MLSIFNLKLFMYGLRLPKELLMVFLIMFATLLLAGVLFSIMHLEHFLFCVF